MLNSIAQLTGSSLLLTAIVFLNFSAKAQVGVGARAGLALGFISNAISSNATITPHLAYNAGLIGEFTVVKRDRLNVAIQVEPTIIGKGVSGKLQNSVAHIDFTNLEMPLLVKLAFGGGKAKGYAEVGFFGSFSINAQTRGYQNGTQLYKNTITSGYSKVDVGPVVGVGTEITLGPGAMIAGLRFEQGVLDLFDNNFVNTQSQRSTAISVNIGYIFRFGKNAANTPISTTDYSTPELEDFSESTTTDDSWDEPAVTEADPVEENTYQRPSEVDQPQSLRVDPQPEPVSEVPDVDFSELIKINKLLDKVADATASDTDRQISKAEVMLKFQSPETPVLIQEGGVTVDYHTITEFLSIIELTHFRYKITDRKMVDGMISEIVMKHIK